ncbi:hypothetical protein [Bradyrhizobium arachidis]|uniref:hypothetical protein n=1 Tax=Bradyrhizobium arachidis TaxID=858423 RepID=UPI001160ADEE|nr:hypothetical protein [Bradyrhizobium arachidis]
MLRFKPIEGWSRDATSDIADALAERAATTNAEMPPARAIDSRRPSWRSDVQPAMPLRQSTQLDLIDSGFAAASEKCGGY